MHRENSVRTRRRRPLLGFGAALAWLLAVSGCAAPAEDSASSPFRRGTGTTVAVPSGGGGPNSPLAAVDESTPDPAAALERLCGTTGREVVAGVAVTTTWACYDVGGRTPEQLRRELNQRGPVDRGRRFDAHTKWHVEWSYPASKAFAGSCRVSGSPSASLRADYLLPRWVDRARGSPELTAEWNRYIAALLAHEQGHAAIGLEVAESTVRALPDLTTSSCDTLQAAAARLFEQILAAGQARERHYDESTGHGATQGARFG